MNKESLKRLKWITIICLIILGIECLYLAYTYFFPKKTKVYFDGINAVINENNGYITVGSNNDNDNNLEKAKISKYNNNKEKTFEKLYNKGYNSAYFGVATDDNNLIAVGSYEKTEADNNDSVRRALIVKYDENQEIEFEEEYKRLDNSKFTSVAVTPDGYVACGQSIYKNTKVGSKEGGAILVKYDKDGIVLWERYYGNSKEAIFNEVIYTNNLIYVVGSKDASTGVIIACDLDGNIVYSSEYQGIDKAGFEGIVTDNNYLYVSGAINDNNISRAMIVKYDSSCEKQNEVIYQDKNPTAFHKLALDKENDLIVIGTLSLPKESEDKTISSYNLDGLVGKYTTDLKEVSVISYGDEKDDYFTDITLVEDDYLITGYSSYEEGSYYSKFIRYSNALKLLGVE